MLAVWPIGFLAMVVAGGGHGSPFDGSASEWIMGAALWAIPVLMIALGIACLAATTRKRLLIVAALAAAIPLDLVLALVAGRIASEPRSGAEFARPAPPLDPKPMRVTEEGIGKSIGIACSVETGECTTTESGNEANASEQ